MTQDRFTVLIAFLTFWLCTSAWAEFPAVPISQTERINIGEYSAIYQAEGNQLPGSIPELTRFVSSTQVVEQISTQSTRYWYVFQLENSEENLLWFNIANRLLKHIRLYQYTDDSVTLLSQSGMEHPPYYPLTYAQPFSAPKGSSVWLIEIEHPYISGTPQLLLSTEDVFKNWAQFNLLIVIACIGSIFLLAPYNLLIGLWSRNKAYFWYAAYLAAVGLQWTTFFNIWDHFFGISSDFFNFTFFNLYVLFGTQFFLTFLRLPDDKQWLVRIAKGWRWTALMIPGYFIWPAYIHYGLLNVVVGGWICLALISGIVSYRSGYRPARFFILGFSLIFIAALTTILGQAHVIQSLDDSYRVSLIAQTIDVVCLSLALADQINTLRKEKLNALQAAIDSEAKAAQTEKEANLKLDTALKVAIQDKKQKQQYMMLIGHELKTPLHTIYAILDDADKNDENIKHHRKEMLTATNTLKRHITNLLALSETTAGNIKPVPNPFNFSELCADVAVELSLVFNKKAPITFRGLSDVPAQLLADNILLQHLLFELAHNAIRFSMFELVKVFVDYNDSELTVRIQDSGPGFPVHLIEDFKQSDSGFTRSTEGLGIGLSVSSNILTILGSKLDITTDENTTSVSFTVEAPVTQQPLTLETHPLCVLVVEDNMVNQKLLVKTVEKLGHVALSADNGAQAIEVVEDETVDLILMDIQMPVLDGIEATRKLKEMSFDKPIIAVTANVDFETREKAIAAGVVEVVGKPIKKEKLRQLLEFYSE